MPALPARPALPRALGRWDLVALVINGVVGAGIFGLPSKVHALLGSWGIIAIVACALLISLVILCFAEVASRFSGTGGPYLYARVAFGPRPAFVVGWLLWLARIAGIGAITSLLVQYLSAFIPAISSGPPRAVLLTVVVTSLAAINVTGVLRAARIGDAITIAKLVPLLVFVGVGVLHVQGAAFDFRVRPSNASFSAAVLLLGFAFVGWESAVVTAGELRNPRRDLPFALIGGLAGVIVLYLAIQIVCVGTLPSLATSDRPLADAASVFMGPIGGTMIGIGAVVSMLGTINGGLLTISRIPFAMAEAGQLPSPLARLHPVYRTPAVSIIVSSVVVLGLTLTSTFTYVATISIVARLLVFAVTCAALPVLRKREASPMSPSKLALASPPAPSPSLALASPLSPLASPLPSLTSPLSPLPTGEGETPDKRRLVPSPLFRLHGGQWIAGAALVLIAWLLASTSWRETRDVLLAAVVGVVLFRGWRSASAEDLGHDGG